MGVSRGAVHANRCVKAALRVERFEMGQIGPDHQHGHQPFVDQTEDMVDVVPGSREVRATGRAGDRASDLTLTF